MQASMIRTRASLLAIVTCLFSHLAAQNESILHDGITRTYIVHIPSGFSDSDTLPLVFSLHGLVMTAESQSDLSEFNPIADRERFIVVYPQGLPNTSGLNAWNTFSSPYYSGVDDVGFISALIDTLHRDYHIDLRRVYSCGMSNGGFMSYRLACELNHRIAAIASVTGSMTDSMAFYCNLSRPFPILHFHGTADAIVNYNGTGSIRSVQSSLDHWLQHNNCPATAVETPLPDFDTSDSSSVKKLYWGLCDDDVEVIHYKVENGGHTWPGSGETFFGVGGNVNYDINASEIIWEFFGKYSLPESLVGASSRFSTQTSTTVYPNPVNDKLTISASRFLEKIRLNDVSGKTRFYLETNHAHNFTIDLSGYPSGMYFLTVEHAESSEVFKILRR